MSVALRENVVGAKADYKALSDQQSRHIGHGHTLIPIVESVKFIPFTDRKMTTERSSLIQKFIDTSSE